jgi:hypothetical protein
MILLSFLLYDVICMVYNIWNVVIDDILAKEIKRKSKNFASHINYGVKKGDIIILCKKKSGYFGLLEAGSDQVKNMNKIKIFRNQTQSRFYFNIKSVILLNEMIDIKDIIIRIKDDEMVGFKNITSYKKKFMKNILEFVSIEYDKGEKIVNLIKVRHHNFKIEELEKTKDILISSESDVIDSIDEPIIDSSSSEEEEEINDVVFIPVMVVPCKEFNHTLLYKRRYVMKHIQNCNLCDVTNNNNVDVLSKMTKSSVKMIDDCKKVTVEEIVDKYWNMEVHYPIKETNSDNNYIINIIPTKNYTDLYKNCLLILTTKRE